MRKIQNAATTIVGPVGVSSGKEPKRPDTTDNEPIIAAITAICSGVRANRRAVAAGIMSNDVISNMPIIFIPIAIVIARRSVKVRRAAITGVPSARANSS